MPAHDLKTWPEYFQEVKKGNKTFEIRKNDRDFKVGDTLFLWEYEPNKKKLTGDFLEAKVTYMTDFAQVENHVVLGLKLFGSNA